MADEERYRGYEIEIGSSRVARRLRSVLAGVNLDGDCREKLNAALDRFVYLESERSARNELRIARQHLQCIAALIKILEEINHISAHETDATIYHELASLFDDVAEAAKTGSAALRELAHGGTKRTD